VNNAHGLALFFLVLSINNVSAEGPTIGGLGNSSCGAWTQARKHHDNGDAWGYEQWVVGYLSGVAEWGGKNPLKNLDFEAVEAWFDQFCQKEPLFRLDEAAMSFVVARSTQPSGANPH
jgi:hypothetical protein